GDQPGAGREGREGGRELPVGQGRGRGDRLVIAGRHRPPGRRRGPRPGRGDGQGHGRVDVLVNNAGAVRDKLLIQMSPADWEELIRTDLMSAFATTRAAIMSGMMRARWGRIVNISSIVGLTGNAGQSNYAAAKAGLIGFTKSVA